MCAVSFAIPSRLLPVSLVAAFVGACAAGGCAKTQTAATSDEVAALEGTEPAIEEVPAAEVADAPPMPKQPAIREEPLGGVSALAAKPFPVKTGLAPLVYLVETAQVVQVVDETAGLIIAESPVRRRTIVRVDERNGVIAGREQLFAGPLPEGRRYGIYVVPDGENVSRSGRYMPLPSPQPMPAEDR